MPAASVFRRGSRGNMMSSDDHGRSVPSRVSIFIFTSWSLSCGDRPFSARTPFP